MLSNVRLKFLSVHKCRGLFEQEEVEEEKAEVESECVFSDKDDDAVCRTLFARLAGQIETSTEGEQISWGNSDKVILILNFRTKCAESNCWPSDFREPNGEAKKYKLRSLNYSQLRFGAKELSSPSGGGCGVSLWLLFFQSLFLVILQPK